MTKADLHTRGTGGDDVADFHIAVGDNDPVNEQLNQLATLGKGRLGEPLLHLLTKSLNRGHDPL
jgi:hypothetical protein